MIFVECWVLVMARLGVSVISYTTVIMKESGYLGYMFCVDTRRDLDSMVHNTTLTLMATISTGHVFI